MTADRAPDQGAEEAAGFSPADVFTALRREGTPDALDDAGRLTDADRGTAADVLFGEFDYGAGMLREERRAVLGRIAAALAAERRRAVEPFETLAADPEKLARFFHETYERLAPIYGYETRRASAVPWEDVPENNRLLMTAVCAEVGQLIRSAAQIDGRPGSEEHAPLRLRDRAAALRGAANATSADLSDEQPHSGTRTPPND